MARPVSPVRIPGVHRGISAPDKARLLVEALDHPAVAPFRVVAGLHAHGIRGRPAAALPT